jgi:cytosine/adenosine deaminase-related metal-dependent hydrolase
MRSTAVLIAPLALLSACKPPDDTELKAIVGAILIDGTGGPPQSDTVILVAGSRFRAVGPRASTPVPAGSDKIDGRGRFVVPGYFDVAVTNPDINNYLKFGVTAVRPPGAVPPREDLRVLSLAMPRVSTLSEAREAVESGANAVLGMIGDTEAIDAGLMRHFRDLRVVFAPNFSQSHPSDVARRNTQKLMAAGVALAVASSGTSGEDTLREMNALAAAGVSPSDVVAAATKNGALAVRRHADLGTIEVGKLADLVVLSKNPLESAGNLGSVEQVMVGGRWQ